MQTDDASSSNSAAAKPEQAVEKGTPAPAVAPPSASGTLSDALDSERGPEAEAADARARPKAPGKEESRLMADTLPGAGTGGA